jgi:pentose-5-phosphate-3-epimerase
MSLSDEFAQTGTNSFLVRWEGNNDLSRAVQRIKALGKQVGVAVNPATAAGVLEDIIQDLDQVLIMTAEVLVAGSAIFNYNESITRCHGTVAGGSTALTSSTLGRPIE